MSVPTRWLRATLALTFGALVALGCSDEEPVTGPAESPQADVTQQIDAEPTDDGESTSGEEEGSFEDAGPSFAMAGGTNVVDLTTAPGTSGSANGAFFLQVDPEGSEGTGNLNPFVRIQASPTEHGVNTSGRPLPFDENSSSNFTRDLLLNGVPQVVCPAGSPSAGDVCRELTLDINEVNSGDERFLSMDMMVLFVHQDPGFTASDLPGGFPNAAPAGWIEIYDLDDGADGNSYVEMDYDFGEGSGSGDLRVYIPESSIPESISEQCDYDQELGNCGHYLTLYSHFGDPSESGDGFEEWAVRILPVVDVQKTVETSVTRTFTWDVTKSSDPSTLDLFSGDDGTTEYTVDVDRTGFTESDWSVSGQITITNPGDVDAVVLSVADTLSPDIAATVDCGVTFPHTITSNGGSLTCDYGPEDLPSGDMRTNTATVVLDDPGTEGDQPGAVFTDDEDVDFSSPDNVTEVDGSATLFDDDFDGDGDTSNDTNLGSFTDDGSTSFTTTFTCDTDEGDHTNEVTLVGDDSGNTLATDDETVTVNCHDLTVTKDADTELTRTWAWDISKTADATSLTLAHDQSFIVNYTVQVDTTGSTDSGWKVSGDITISNPNPSLDAELTGVVDSIFPDEIEATVSCPSTTVPMNDGTDDGTLTCSYGPVSLSDGSSRTNTATATLQNHSYDEDGVATVKSGTTTDFSGSQTFDFTSPDVVNEVDESITVVDDNATPLDTSDDVTLGTAAITDVLPKDFEFSRTFGPFGTEQCGTHTFTNTAEFTTVDQSLTGSDDHTVSIEVTCPPTTCTLTQGYWKTHNESFHGGAPTDETWELIEPAAEQSEFFDSGQTYFDVFWTPIQGNKVYSLAHQYIAAELNLLAGASMPSGVQDVFDLATTWFENNATGDTFPEVRGKDAKMLTEWAETLAAYNEGDLGPGHCDEDFTSTF